MDEQTEEAIERLVVGWPELTEETKAKLGKLLSPDHGTPTAKDEWVRRQLEKMPERSQEWKDETLRLWGLKPGSLDEPS